MNNIKLYDMIIVGGGPGGYASALYAARAGLSVLVLEKLSAGGQMALTDKIDNYSGFADGIDGWQLAFEMQRQAERFGAVTEYAEVRSLDLNQSPKIIDSSAGIFHAKTVVIATGAGPRELGLPNEMALLGRGVGYCAACDGMF
ncbi:MAG: FAD-dependent oxidoreductase, partial [Oscillospiraceae bacterium]|nr:FAD-dependent oxidoreductase [Oscillospiraceae bacterium]